MAKIVRLPEKTPVPSNWVWVELGKMASTKSGYPFDSKRFSADKEGKKPIIRIRDVVRGYTETYTDEICPEEYIIRRGKILIGMDGDFNLEKWNSSEALLNQRVCCIESTSESLLNDFMYYYLPIPLKFINEATPSITVKHLSTKTIAKIPFPIPPLSEQQRIVSRIESLFAKIDEAKEKAKAVVDGFELRKSTILHKAFTGELTARWRKEHGVGLESWKKLTLNDVAEYKKGPFGSSITKAMFVPKGENTYKVFEQGNAIRKTTEYGHYYISGQKYSELKGFAVKAGDIIISCAGTIGEVYKLPSGCEAGIINQALMRVRLYNNINELFFVYYFGEALKGDIIDQANGTAIKNIPPFKVMKALPIFLPSLLEQEEIVRIIGNLCGNGQQAKEAAEAVLDQIDTMKKAILARAFRGELGTNDPKEESAVELVKTTFSNKQG